MRMRLWRSVSRTVLFCRVVTIESSWRIDGGKQIWHWHWGDGMCVSMGKNIAGTEVGRRREAQGRP